MEQRQPGDPELNREHLRQELETIQGLVPLIEQRISDALDDLGVMEARITNIERVLNGEEPQPVQMTVEQANAYVDNQRKLAQAALAAGEDEQSVRERFGIYGGLPLDVDLPERRV